MNAADFSGLARARLRDRKRRARAKWLCSIAKRACRALDSDDAATLFRRMRPWWLWPVAVVAIGSPIIAGLLVWWVS